MVEFPCTWWPMDDYWGDGRLSRYFIGGIPRVARINHDTLVTGPNVTFVCCSFECANALEAAMDREWPAKKM